ncbi:nuclear transport factor 2 family protein [Natronorarus salvus]|uniref:nuclear transport factor 2 family protein n=1 Tax=Natronorarus salvus TaxID=3117733 RepID=UPI002F26C7C4
MTDREPLVRAYYRALDDHRYDELRELLSPEFGQQRPDRCFESRGAFVRFMREERPLTDTTHEVIGCYTGEPGIAIRGRLLDSEGEELFEFVDVFSISDGLIDGLVTYTD